MEYHLIYNKLKQQNMYYRIYAKFAGQTKFQPLDLSTGQQVINLIYATLIPAENLGKVQQIIEDNKDVKFEIRKAN
jgi:hypothetical protein